MSTRIITILQDFIKILTFTSKLLFGRKKVRRKNWVFSKSLGALGHRPRRLRLSFGKHVFSCHPVTHLDVLLWHLWRSIIGKQTIPQEEKPVLEENGCCFSHYGYCVRYSTETESCATFSTYQFCPSACTRRIVQVLAQLLAASVCVPVITSCLLLQDQPKKAQGC